MLARSLPTALALAAAGVLFIAREASAVNYTWNVLGGGTQSWTTAANWNPSTGTPSSSSDTADLRVALVSSLSLDLGASGTVTSGWIAFGGTSGAVTTDVISSGATLVLNNATTNGQILSQGVAGSVNRISAPLILAKNTDILQAGTRDFTITGTLGQVGAGVTFTNQLVAGPTLTIGSGTASRIQLYDSLTPATGRNLVINNLSSASGTAQATVINALWDRGASNGTITIGNSQNPAAVYSLLVSQTSSANVQINRQRFVVAADNALGVGEVTANNSSTTNWGGAIQSNDDARVLGNSSFRISNLASFTGSNSLTITGTFYQSNTRGFGNGLAAGKQLNLNGTIAMDNTATARTMIVEGSGKTVMNGRVINAFTDTVQGTLVKRGSGRLELTNATNTLSGTWSSQGGLIVFGTAGSYGTAVIQTGSAGGVSYAPGTADAGWATFASRLTGSGMNVGYLALPAADSAANLDFTTTLANAPSLSVVGDGDMTYTGVVTPGSAGYNWGGLSGVLTLPAHASTGANTVKITNGGTVVIAGSQSYSGATTVQGVLMQTSQNGITSGAGSYTAATTIAFPSTLSVSSLGNAGSASSLGSSSGVAANLVLDRATLRYTGTSNASTDRLFTIGANGATLESTGAGGVTFGSAGGANVAAGSGARSLTLGGASTAANTVGSILANGATGSDLLSVVKTDAGTWVLGGANTYTGTTNVNAGTLLINGNQAAANGAVTVAAGATIGGSGTTGGTVTVNGTLSPGNSPGVLTAASMVLGGSSTSLFEISGTTRGTQYDGVNITAESGLTYGGALMLSFGNASAFGATTFGLFSFTGTASGNFTSVTSTGFYAGAWSLASGTWSLDSGGQTLSFTPTTGAMLVSVPEPTTYSMALAGLAYGGFAMWRRRRA